jgi:hypothetical protein
LTASKQAPSDKPEPREEAASQSIIEGEGEDDQDDYYQKMK